jgi:carbon monoxide dehydrogenase subunit G
MKYSSSVKLPVSQNVVRPFITDLDKYPEWMPLVHQVEPDGDQSWNVELRAKVGVFARSKRLRMTRTVLSDSAVVFERDEQDGRQHSPWTMKIDLVDRGVHCDVTIHLSYGGSLWIPGVLDRVLASHVDAGKVGLARTVTAQA